MSYTGAEPAEATGAFWDGEAGVFVVFDGAQRVLTVAPDGSATDTGLTTATKLRGGLIP